MPKKKPAKKKPARPKSGPQPDGGFVLYDAPPPDYAKLRPDVAETAYRTMLEATGQAEKTQAPSERSKDARNPTAVQRGKAGGLKGGTARAHTLTPERRQEIARIAASRRGKGKE